jgi:hypothetical protein
VKNKKILLVASTDLKKDSVGKLFIESFVNTATDIDFTAYVQQQFLLTSKKYAFNAIGKLSLTILTRIGLIQTFRIFIYKLFYLHEDVELILRKSSEVDAGSIWITLSTIELILISNELIKKKKRVKVTVWDAPEYLSNSIHLYAKSTKHVMQVFGEVIKNSNQVSVISDAMKREYLNLYGVTSSVIRHVIPQCSINEDKNNNKIRIVFGGSLYSKNEWNSFISALEEVNWKINQKPVYLYFIGSFPRTGVKKSNRIIFTGVKTFEQTMQLMMRMNIGYLPYWLDQKFSMVARTSFPGKLSAYAASGLAVFHHGPEYAEASSFLNKFQFGLTCSSLDRNTVVSELSKLDIHSTSPKCVYARENAMQTELSVTTMSKRFAEFIS